MVTFFNVFKRFFENPKKNVFWDVAHVFSNTAANLWRQAILRGHGGATRRPKLAIRERDDDDDDVHLGFNILDIPHNSYFYSAQ